MQAKVSRNQESELDKSRAEQISAAAETYGRAMAVVMMVLGLRQWAIIIGVMSGVGGTFETMTLPWQIATAQFAVVDLVASVGLWQRAAWGNVIWIYAAAAEIFVHTAMAGTFGGDYLIVAFHGATVAVFFSIQILLKHVRKVQNRRN